MLEANDMVEAKLAEIREKKIYEMKRMFAAKMDEVFGSKSVKQLRDMGYVKASDPVEKGGLGLSPYDVAQKKSKARKAQPPKRKSIFDIDMSKEKKISEETLDEAGLGDAARLAHSMTDKEKALFKAGRKGSILAALKFKRSIGQKKAPSSAPQASTYQRPGMIKRNINTLMGQEPGHVDERTPEEKLKQKGGRGGKAIRAVGKGLGRAAGSIASDLADIGTRHL